MMFKFSALTLICRRSREVLRLSPHVSFFHGQISTGKSSIARLIDFCLGADIEMTTALEQEMVSAQLEAQIGTFAVVLEREKGANRVQVTWRDSDGAMATLLAPIQTMPNQPPIWGENVQNLSDLIFHFLGITPIKVRRSGSDEASPLVRLSFRDISWYCYLRQDQIDSTFFNLDKPFQMQKSRDVMRFVVGYYTQRLNDLEIELESVASLRSAKLEGAKQIRIFLQEFGFGSEKEISDQVDAIRMQLNGAVAELARLSQSREAKSHPVDELRRSLRDLSNRLDGEELVQRDLANRIVEQESLKAELLSTKFKMVRAESASGILSGASFERCPLCGSGVRAQASSDGRCPLCGALPQPRDYSQPQAELLRRDLASRIEELSDSIERHKLAQKDQRRVVAELRERKLALDSRLTQELREYDSAFLSQSREQERLVATLQERLSNLERARRMPEAISQLESEADQLGAREQELKRRLEEERGSLGNAETLLAELESTFLQAMLTVGVPGVRPSDKVDLNRRTWIPWILPEGDRALRWNFYNAGSGGKKTLVNACYAVAVHLLASRHDLPLPSYLIIDTPMKNIGEDVNRELFAAFYQYLYGLAATELSGTQFILIDKEYMPPEPVQVDVTERFMSSDRGDRPPLISYYHGP